LDFMGLIMGSLKSPCTTSCRSPVETMALNCIVFEKIAFLYFGNRQTNRQTDEQMDRPVPLHEAALAVASGGSKIEVFPRQPLGTPVLKP